MGAMHGNTSSLADGTDKERKDLCLAMKGWVYCSDTVKQQRKCLIRKIRVQGLRRVQWWVRFKKKYKEQNAKYFTITNLHFWGVVSFFRL